MLDFTLVGGSFFLPKTQLVHGTNWWVYCPFSRKTVSTLVHGTKGFIFRVSNPKKNILPQISILGMGFEVFLSVFWVFCNFKIFCVTCYLSRLH